MTRLIYIATLLLVSTAVSTGCGVNKDVHQKALDDLALTQNRLRDAESDRDHKAKRLKALEGELGETQAERDRRKQAQREKEEEIAKLLVDMQATREQLLEVQKQQKAAQERLAAFNELNKRLRALVDTGKLKVAFRRGEMVLELPSEVLFASGEADLSDAGETALAEVLQVLGDFKDRRFLIAGHTDNVKIRSRRFKNNWYLSTARAVSVVEFMIEAGFAPGNLAAAGYGEFAPVAPNDSDENRQRNRRIELILIPDLSELPNLASEPS